MQAITLENLVVRRGERRVLAGISLQVARGEIVALLGGNGAGKSTTLLSLLGFLVPDSGQVTVLGESVFAAPVRVRRQIAYLPESANLYEHLNAYENLEYLLSIGGLRRSRADMDSALDRVALQQEARGRRLQGYSKGMRQKAAIALALLREAPILLLDEPTSGLDPLAIEEFHSLLRTLADEGRAILLVTHDLYGACQVADRVALLRNGALSGEFQRQPDARINLDAVLRCFGGKEAA